MMDAVEMVTLTEAEADLKGLLLRVQAGNEIIVTRDGAAVAKLVPIRPRVAGGMKHQVTVIDENWWAADSDHADLFGTSG